MATQTSSSNTRLVAIGAVVLLVGVILVLLILRGTVGDDDPAAPETAANDTPTEQTAEPESAAETELVERGDATARVPLPLELEDGQEAVTVRASFVRGVAALPTAGDRVAVYQLGPAPDDDDDEPAFPTPGDAAERVLEDVEVLGVIGPRPAANDGRLTFVLALDEADVAGLLPMARDAELWLTLLPDPNGDPDEDEGDDE